MKFDSTVLLLMSLVCGNGGDCESLWEITYKLKKKSICWSVIAKQRDKVPPKKSKYDQKRK